MDAADMPSPSPSSTTGSCPGNDKSTSVEVLIIMAFVAMLVLHVLGSLRRRSSHRILHAAVMGVYTLSYPLVGYTIGWMNSSDWDYFDFAVWAVLLVLLLGCTDGLTALRLSDIDNWKSIYVKHVFKGVLVVYFVVYFVWDPDMKYLRYPVSAIMVVGILKWYLRIASMRMASTSQRSKNVKVISEYMQRIENLPGAFNPVTMQGYRYMVAGERYCVKRRRPGRTPWYQDEGLMAKVTTVEQIWQCTGNLLVLDERGKSFKDVCLSMALSKMLNRRFAGFKLTEAGLDKTHDLVFKGLLLAGDGKPYQRAFRVIEDELVFVHDMYFTRYYYLFQKGRCLALCLPVIMFGLLSWLTCQLIKHRSRSLAITICIIVALALLEAYQLYLYIASGWFKVALIQSYVCTPSLQRNCCFIEKVIGFLLRLKSFRPWKDRLGQYCILQELGRKNRLRSWLHYATLGLVDKARKGRQNSVKLSENVKKAIVQSLLGCNGNLTNVVTSLRNNGVHSNLSWACDNATAADGAVTRTILRWHIATTLCLQQGDAQFKGDDAVTTASTLSQYCMHLLVFAPNLLPDHSSVSEAIIDDAIVEAGELLRGANTLEERCKELMETISTGHRHDRGGHEAPLVVAQGAQLAGRLVALEPTKRWKVLSDFWAEMMLYVSPSDDARAHLEALAKGGEFITHLWALLTHAGVLKRGPSGSRSP
ncbi:hypothetical protein U9M48_001293 [Paspalum notatum var. saurae]|uniref:DUF4220 domain-containing protein n=1 Tax=Paspalum notatum var. saurae TaxID=547442 RepID=A0AAQ3PG67_PASNO